MPDFTLRRPAIIWPAGASLLAYEFSRLVVDAVHAALRTDGRVWLRLGDDAETKVGVSLIVSVYALWSSGFLDIVAHEGPTGTSVVLASCSHREEDLAPLEQDILDQLDARGELHPRELVGCLPFPSKKRGLGAWFVAGCPSRRSTGKGGWFALTSTFEDDRPASVQRALDLAKALVALAASSDVEDEAERDRRDDAMHTLEAEVFDALQKLP